MITKAGVIKYAVLPGFFPRLWTLFSSGFVHIAYFMALVYSTMRLLPPDHPYLNPQNFGRYGIRHVVAEAANNLVISRQNIDQIIVFVTLLIGLVLLVVQIGLFIFSILTYQPALAVTLVANPSAEFGSLGPQQDIAFIVLDRVFGLQNIYNSCISDLGTLCEDLDGNPLPTPNQYPFSLHLALHTLLEFYSRGIFVVAVFILIYFATTIVAETAATGTPFGQRYNKTWVPVRIIVFFALLVPLNIGKPNGGLNAAQLITFHTAKWGSNFASNAWGIFNTRITDTFLGQADSLIASPEIPEIGSLIQFIYVAKVCKIAEEISYGHEVLPFLVRPEPPAFDPTNAGGGLNRLEFIDTAFATAKAFASQGNIKIRFGTAGTGEVDEQGIRQEYKNALGNVFPYCGDITIHVTDTDTQGSALIQEGYYNLLKTMWDDGELNTSARCNYERIAKNKEDPGCVGWPDTAFTNAQVQKYTNIIRANVQAGIDAQKNENDEFQPSEDLLQKGWGGAAIWYNRIARLNGAVTTAVFNIPRPDSYPYLMEIIAEQSKQQNAHVSPKTLYNPQLADGKFADLPRPNDRDIAPILLSAYEAWSDDSVVSTNYTEKTGNIIIDIINTIIGTNGVFSMRDNNNIHPLAQLSALGKGLMEATVRNAAYATAGVVGGGLGGILKEFAGKLVKSGGDFLFVIVAATLGISIILYYVLPFLPFIYFIFALSGWVKSIFEAVVAMPLWAVAHIRIDGEGLPGPAASQGYFLLLEIFLRPIMILFGLLLSISIFSATVYILNDVFDLVVANAGGFDHRLENEIAAGGVDTPSQLVYYRNTIDEFAFTVMYAVICYMIGTSAFKLIDAIPNKILRWMGATVETIQENAGDPAAELSSQIFRSSGLIGGQLRGQVQGNLALIVGTG